MLKSIFAVNLKQDMVGKGATSRLCSQRSHIRYCAINPFVETRRTRFVGESLDDSTELTSGQEPICIEFSGIFIKGLVNPHLSSANSLKRNKFQTPASCKG